jgi:NAD(P)-dependent dehydrogenase (short-subunit alcohol dehydrogenase family)
MSNVIVVIGPGSIGQAIARRVSAGKHVLLAGLRQVNADAAAEVLSNAGFEVSTVTVDVSARESVHPLVQTATALGTSPASSTRPAFPPAKRRLKQSFRSTCTAPPWCSRSSAMSSRRLVPAS